MSEIRCNELYQSLEEIEFRRGALQIYMHVNLLKTGVIITVGLLQSGADKAFRLLLTALS